jgi:hypothetical protein
VLVTALVWGVALLFLIPFAVDDLVVAQAQLPDLRSAAALDSAPAPLGELQRGAHNSALCRYLVNTAVIAC